MKAAAATIETVRVGDSGTIALPPRHRKRLKLTKGSRVLVFPLGKGVMVVPADRTIDGLTQRIEDALAAKGVSARRALRGLETTRQRIFQQLYGEG
jgi:bifunctional DNA-binding transcriptional regulator/antitoxin component of YhaV-PrlF toxin-antitoxin module